jgi:hypothetical protein
MLVRLVDIIIEAEEEIRLDQVGKAELKGSGQNNEGQDTKKIELAK